MAEKTPVVYIFHGENEVEIADAIAGMQARLSDPSLAEVNTSYLDGRSHSLDTLETATMALPFFIERRLVILVHPLSMVNSQDQQGKFTRLLERVPASTALVLVEYRILTDESKRRKGELHWLEKWAKDAGDRVYLRYFPVPKGADLVRWIQGRAAAAGGQLSPRAAALLAQLAAEDSRFIEQEVQKLFAYVNYSRKVEAEDVERLTPSIAKAQDFGLVNALRNRDSRQAYTLLQKELEERDPLSLLHFRIIPQIRQLLLARDILDRGGDKEEIASQLSLSSYPAKLAAENARRFKRSELEEVYRRLLDLDEAMKTGRIDGELALDILVAEWSG